jgi:hypothetical protein
MVYLSRVKYLCNVTVALLLPEEYRGVSAAVLLLVLLQAQPGRVAGVSGFVDQRPDAIIFLFSGFAAYPIHLIDTGSVVFRGSVIENP